MVKVNIAHHIRHRVIKNLLHAHERVADQGRAMDLIRLTKVILKLAKQFDNELLDLSLEEADKSTEQPPNEGEENIP